MSESIEHAMEYIVAGVLFCVAIAMLLLLHGMFLNQVRVTGKSSDRLIMIEQSEEREWKLSDEP